MTDEQFLLYFDLGAERQRRDWSDMVDAVRVGYVTARDEKALRKWTSRSDRPRPRGLTGGDLEKAVMSLALSHPEYVVLAHG